MALVNSAFTVNVTPGAMPPVVHVSEYDTGRTYTVTINGQNGSAFNIPTGTTATVEGTLNGVIGFTTDATISGSTVSFTLTESMTAKSGKAWCKIKLTLNDEPIQTCAFILSVDRAGVEAETVIGAPGFEGQVQDAVDDYLAENPISVDQEQIQDAVDSWFDDHGGALTVDNVLSGTSENPVQNKVVTAALNNKGTYSKPSGGIPASDLAPGVIPTVPQMATQANMSDWTSGKTVDAAVLKNGVQHIERTIEGKADASDIPTAVSELTNDSGFVNASEAAAAAPVQSVNGKTGAVEINDVPDYSTATTGYVLAKTGANTLGWIPPYDPSSPEHSELQEWLASDAPDDVSEALLTYLTDNNLWQDGVDPAFYAALTAAARAGKLPNVTAADNGKIAIASNGAWTVGQAPVQSVNGRTGAVTVNEVPDASGASVGQVLSKTENGLGWTTPSGGGGGAASLIISLYLNSQTGVYTCSASPTQLYNALPNCALAAAEHTIPVTDYKKGGANYVTAVFVDPAYENEKLSAIVWTLTAATSSSTVTVTREEVAVDGVPDSTSATVGQVLTKAQDGPRWGDNIPSEAASLRLLYDGVFDQSDPDLMLKANLANLETGAAICGAIVSGTIGSAALVDVTSSNDVKVYDLYAYDYANDIVVFARTEGALIRTATLSGSTKAAPVFGTIPLGGLPAVSAADNDKFLRVVNGAWAAQAVPSAESNSFGGGA